PVRPGETLTLEHEPLPNGSIAFRIASAGQAVAHGVLVPAIAPTGPHDARGAAVPAGPRASAAQWAGAPERGSATLLRIMIFLSLRLGRPVARGSGAFLLGAHLGSFEIMSAVGRRQAGLRVAMAMYEHNASRVAAFFRAGNRVSAPEIIALGRLGAMLRIRDCLDAGRFVG